MNRTTAHPMKPLRAALINRPRPRPRFTALLANRGLFSILHPLFAILRSTASRLKFGSGSFSRGARERGGGWSLDLGPWSFFLRSSHRQVLLLLGSCRSLPNPDPRLLSPRRCRLSSWYLRNFQYR